MSYRLSLTKDPGADLLRIVSEQLDEAITQLEQQRTASRTRRVHEARKAIKKTRSALRLIRRAIPTEAYAAAITTLRDVARNLAPLRDADVMQQTAAALTNKPKPATTKPSRTPLPPFAAPLHQLKTSLATWPLQDIDPVIIAKGFAQTIRAFQQAFNATTNTNDPELFHTWRKRAKDLRYQSLILEPLWPAIFQAIADTAQKTEEHLGEDHDLAVLAQQQPQYTAQATERQQQLRRKARKLGQRLSAEDPKAWKRRIIAWFHL